MDIDDLPEWPADKPLPDGTVTVVGAQTVEEAADFLRRQREAEERRRREAEANHRQWQARQATEVKDRAEVLEGLRRLGSGEVKVEKPRRRAPGGGRKVAILPALVAGVAIRYLLDAERDDERMKREDAITLARKDLGLTEYQAPTSTVGDRIRDVADLFPDLD